ncbi:MAG: hypothetical protein ABI456_00345 [Ktedonobacteraceae bacterium]
MRQRTPIMAYFVIALLVVATILLAGYERSLQASSTSTAATGSSGMPMQSTATVTAPSPMNRTIAIDGQMVPLAQACHDHSRPSPRLIIDATTTSTPLAGHWNTPDRVRPANISTRNVSLFSIVTPLRFSALHIIVDTRRAKTGEMATLGGRAGADQIHIIGGLYPTLQAHQRYLLFFDPGISEQQLVVVAAFRIIGPNTVVAQEQSVEQGQVTQAEVRLSLSHVTAQLQTNCR